MSDGDHVKTRINIMLNIYDEYVYKVLFLIFGILYWVYGLTPYVDRILSLLVYITLIPVAINLVRIRKTDFRHILSVLTLFLGIITIILSANRRPTFTMLLYSLIKMLVLAYCSSRKSDVKLEQELIRLFRIIVVIGTIILVISLLTYHLGVSIPYVYSSRDDATVLYVGRASLRGGLCGIFANENMISNLCVIYLGSILFLTEKSGHKLIGYILVLMDVYAQYLTSSRGGLVGLVVILGMYIWFKYKTIMSFSRVSRLIRWLSIIVLICCMILYLGGGGHFDLFSILNRTQENYDRNTQIRLYLWSTSIRATTSSLKNALFGIGHGISDVMAYYSEVALASRLYTNVHNAYLQKALEFGVPASLIMIIYNGKMLLTGLKYIRKTIEGNIAIQLLAGMVIALLITNTVESDMLGRAFEGTVVWMFSGYLYAICSKRINAHY